MDLRPLYTATSEAAAKRTVCGILDQAGPAIPGGHQAVGERLERVRAVPGLCDGEIRRVICSTNAIESLNAGHRRAVRARCHFTTEQAALKCLYVAPRALDPPGTVRARWASRWKPALNAFAISFDGRIN
jgi:putative transposase